MHHVHDASQQSALFDAVAKGDAAAVRDLVAKGAPLDGHAPDSGLTPLMMASGYGHDEVVGILLEAGADPFVCDSRSGGFALHKAAQGGSDAIARRLLDAGLFIDCRCATTGHTPLIEAIWFKKVAVVELLLERNARTDVKTNYGFTLEEHVNYALMVNQKPKEQALLQRIKAALDERKARDAQRVTDNLLVAASVKDDTEEVKRLLAGGADIEMRTPIMGNFDDDHTALLLAVRDGHDAAAQVLIDAGADTNAVEPTFMAVPLHKATYNGRTEMTRALAAVSKTDINFQGLTNGYSPLHDALWHGFEDCAMILVQAGADLTLRGHDGLLAYDIAVDVLGEDAPVTREIAARTNRG